MGNMDSEQRVYEHAITLTYLKVYLNSLNISNKFHKYNKPFG